MEIFKLLLFYVMMYAFGFSIRKIVYLFIEKPNFHFLEQFSIDFSLGMFLITIYMFSLNILGVRLSGFMIYLILIPSFIIVLISFVLFSNKKSRQFVLYKINIKSNLFSLILIIYILVIIVYFWTSSISSKIIYPDELAVWGLFPKNYFIKKSMFYNMQTGLEHYPPFVALLSSAYYFFINRISDNMVRGFSSLFLFLTYLNLFGFTIRRGFNIITFNISFYLMVKYGLVFGVIASAYADMSYMYFFSIGTIYLIEHFENVGKSRLFHAIILLACTTWIKLDGIILLPILYALILGYQIIYTKSLALVLLNSRYWQLIILTMLPGLTWQVVYRFFFLISKKSPLDLENFKFQSEYIQSMFNSMWTQISSNIVFLLIVIALILILILLPRIKYSQRKLVISLVLSIVSVFVFHVLAYLLLFKIEASTAASFLRYMYKILPLGIVIELILFDCLYMFVIEKNSKIVKGIMK